MKYVVKLGGAGLETPSLLDGSMRAIAELVRDGNQVAVVHGGGVQLTRMLKALGKQSEFIGGLRVTDAETRDIALMVLAGKVNKGLVAALGALGLPAVGLTGGDVGLKGAGCFLTVDYGGKGYCVPDSALNTKRILGLLAQLLALSTTVQDVGITQQVQLLPQ